MKNIKKPKEGDLQVWWITQVPMKAFTVPVSTPEEAKKLLNVLADYDMFQFKNNVKPDYSNAGGLQRYESDGDGGFDWYDWTDENGDDIDNTEMLKGAE
jgi:hypothetical protein